MIKFECDYSKFLSEAELSERSANLADLLKRQQPQISRRKLGGNAFAAADHGLHLVQLARHGLGFLRTDREAAPAEDAVVLHDLRPAAEHRDRLDLAVSDALVAVPAFGGIEVNDSHIGSQTGFSLPGSKSRY